MLDQEPRYESYKNSGVPWIGDAPEDWQILPGRACLYENKDKNTGMIEETVLSLSYGTVRVKPVEEQVGLMPESYETYQIVRPGDIIIRGTDLQNDVTSLRTGLAKNNGIITSAYINLRPRPNVSPFYLHYLLHSYDLMKVFYGLGSGLRQNLSYEDFKKIPLPYPDLDTQNRIVNFLDEKTAEIDAAIAKKRQLIDLLNEQKAILINRAVTRGLNPDAPMKDSGVDWIGEIPAHWGVKKFKYLARRLIGGSTPFMDVQRFWDGDIPWASPKDMISDFLVKTLLHITKEGANANSLEMVPSSSLVFVARSGVLKNRIPVALTQVPLTLNQDMKAVVPKVLTPEYLFTVFTGLQRILLKRVTKIGATVDSIEIPDLMNFALPYPKDTQEQIKIVEFSRNVFSVTKEALDGQILGIDTLNEFKQTLIANAVTGKIKI